MRRIDPYAGRKPKQRKLETQRQGSPNSAGGQFPAGKTRRLGDVKSPYLTGKVENPFSLAHDVTRRK
jgi:hypothetical protein